MRNPLERVLHSLILCGVSLILTESGRMKIAFIIADNNQNNLVVLFETVKVQSIILTEVSD